MKIERIDRATLRVLDKVASEALAAALLPYGVTVAIGRCVYSNGSTGKMSFDITVSGANPEKETFERYAPLLGLQASDYGREFTVGGERYMLTGVDLGRPKFPFSSKRMRDGKGFKHTESAVRAALGRNASHQNTEVHA